MDKVILEEVMGKTVAFYGVWRSSPAVSLMTVRAQAHMLEFLRERL
ncbi:hypothetical protein [Pseudomonas citri]|nr:hypothetical protein [Pseudomonas citri]